MMKVSLILEKMVATLADPVQYSLTTSDGEIKMNSLIGKKLSLEFSGEIFCLHCGKKTKKSFGQGYCFHHFSTLAANDMCILKPELCHYRQGTCREPAWGEAHCLKTHIIYLANSSGLKVGITRQEQVPTRWIDQGASQAMALFAVKERWHAGLVEVMLASHYPDKTNWRTMLQAKAPALNLFELAQEIKLQFADRLRQLTEEVVGFELLPQELEPININYPVIEYPLKVNSLSFDKLPIVSGTLMGIKGQYLIFDSGVLNIRKHGGYKINLSVTE